MRNRIRNQLLKNLLVGLLLSATAGVAQASANPAKVAGTWDVVLTLRTCATGDPIPNVQPIKELATFDLSGTAVTSTTSPQFPPANKTTGHGSWRPTSLRTFVYAFKFYRFDAGVLVGSTVIRQQATLDVGGDSYTAVGVAQVFNLAGVLVAGGCSTTTATRFQ